MLFHFNLYSGLLLPPVLHGLLFAVLLFWRGTARGRLSDRLLGALVLLLTLRVANWMLGFAGWYDAHNAYSTFLFYFPFNYWFAFGPLLYFYFRSLTNRAFRFERKHLWHFLPALLDLGLYAYAFLLDVVWMHGMQGQPFPEHYGSKGPHGQLNDLLLAGILDYLVIPALLFYVVLTLRHYRQYRTYVEAHFSDADRLALRWLRNLLYVFLAALLVWLAFQLADRFWTAELSYVQYWYSYFIWGIIVYYVSIAGYGSRMPDLLPLYFVPGRPAEETEAVDTGPEPAHRTELTAFMKTHRPYLQSELSLQDLAKQMELPQHVLSRRINSAFGQNFNDFVNAYRVEAVKEMLLSGDAGHLSLLGIAYECGFNSKATFNRVFRKFTGQSPTEFRKAQHPKGDSD